MYIALYRKLRSLTFDDMIGQQHLTRTIKNQILTNTLSHAYLFCGIRGTGKTSVARILARAVNCTANRAAGGGEQTAEPCNICEVCRDILSERSIDVIEVNAASQNSVDDVRRLIDDAAFAPIACKYKVYIIDEVHMFSSGAFNAFLKLLEEPPSHVLFLLATTEAQKIPSTILSRVQRFDLRRITVKDTVQYLRKQSEELQLEITDDALYVIAAAADGSMRDALNLLEQCAAFFYDCPITAERVQNLLGQTDRSVLFALTEAIKNRDAAATLGIIENAANAGRDITHFVIDFMAHLRNILIAASAGVGAPIEASDELIEKMGTQGKGVAQETLLFYITQLAALPSELRNLIGANKRVMFEVCCIKLMHPEGVQGYDALSARVARLEEVAQNGAVGAAAGADVPLEHSAAVFDEYGDINFEIEEE